MCCYFCAVVYCYLRVQSGKQIFGFVPHNSMFTGLSTCSLTQLACTVAPLYKNLGDPDMSTVRLVFVLFVCFIDFSHKAHKTWVGAHIKQSKTLANIYHTRGNYTRPNTHEKKLSATWIETGILTI